MNQIQWFPGHMSKTYKQIESDIKLVDIILELLDARIPISSSNPELPKLIGNKKRLILLNKSDLSDDFENQNWLNYYKNLKIPALCINSTKNNKYTKKIYSMITDICKEKFEKNMKKGIKNTTIRAMVIGIPNVGKSTLINSICNKASAKTGNIPGVTKSKQWIRLNKNIELLDTPGILWPKFDDEKTGRYLAFIGSIKDNIIDINDLSFELIKLLKNNYSGLLFNLYNVNEKQDHLKILNDIAIKRNCLKKGALADIDKVSKIILDDFRKSRIGHITLEKPYDK